MIIGFDFEVFKEDWLVVFLDMSAKEQTVIVNDPDALRAYYEAHINDIFVGYNSKGYDQYILKGILAGFDPKLINDYIIVEGNPGWLFSNELMKYPLTTYDCMENIDRGLKVLEGFLGASIEETSVPFDIDRKLTQAEIEETIRYCAWDVEQTMTVFMHRYSDFQSRFGLVQTYGLPLRDISKTKAQLSAKILGAQAIGHKADLDEFDLSLPDTLRIEKYQHIADWYMDESNRTYYKAGRKNQLITQVAGVEHVFGYGGVHGARRKYHGRGFFLNVDVASLYPSLMIEYNLHSRAIPDPAKFREIRDTRLEYKHAGDPRQAALKIVLNSTYGAMKDKHSPLFDPRQANLVCVYGQILLVDLMEHLEAVPGLQIIQSNTDGVLMKLAREEDYDVVDDIAHDWEQRTRLDLEFEEYREVFQKDVNGYLMVDHDGGYKAKGAWLKKLGPLDCDLPIVNKALVDYMVRGIPVERTIYEAEMLKDFQLVGKASSKYEGILHGEQMLNERVIRMFASKRSSDGGFWKIHKVRGKQKMPSSPVQGFIWNEDINDVRAPEHLDRDWYVALCRERLKEFGI